MPSPRSSSATNLLDAADSKAPTASAATAPAKHIADPSAANASEDRVAPSGGDSGQSTALAVADPFVAMVERLAANKDVDVEKMRALLDMNERVINRNARAEFDAAFAQMQPEMPAITEKGEIVVKGQIRSRYAKLEDIQAAIKPVLAKFGFAIRHKTEWPGDGVIRIIGILSHRSGHSDQTAFEAPMDRSEFRTDIQSQGSTISYGRRYTTIDLLNIETRGTDDDGAKAGRPAPPDGYDEWLLALSQTASDGIDALEKTFRDAKREYRQYLTQCDAILLAKMKMRARGAQAAS